MKSDKKIAIMVTAIMVVSVFAFALVMPVSAPDGVWYFKSNYSNYAPSGMPDFDQKQDNWKEQTTGQWSFCGPTAVANCFWWFDSKYANQSGTPGDGLDEFLLVQNYGVGDDHLAMNVDNASTPWPDYNATGELVERLAWCMDTDGVRTGTPRSGTSVIDMEQCIDDWLNETGLNDTLYEHTVKAPDFYWIEAEIERSQDVILLLGFWQLQYPGNTFYTSEGDGVTTINNGDWVRIGGHYVTCAGVNSSSMMLALSDPFFDNAVVTGWGHIVPNPHPPGYLPTFHNNATNVSHDYYSVQPGSGSPGGEWWIPDYGVGQWILDAGTTLVNFQGQNCPYEFSAMQGEFLGDVPLIHTEIEYAVVISPKPSIEVNKTVWNGTAWVKSLDAKINDTLRFNCTIHNSGEVNLTQIRFWDILDCSLNYSDRAMLNGGDIELYGNYVFKPKVLHPDNLSWDPYNPSHAEKFYELCPEEQNHSIYILEDTNEDGRLSECDQIDMGCGNWYHVDNVPYTLNVTNMETGEHMYIDSEQDYEEVSLHNPVCTQWNEVCCCKDSYHLQNWTDVDSGILNEGDFIVLRNKRTGEVDEYLVEEVTIDLVVSKEWKIDELLNPTGLILEPCQTITIEYNATVVRCGVDNNTFHAKGWYSGNLDDRWYYSNEDVVTITVPCPSGDATDPTGLVKDVYTTGEDVYAVGTGFPSNTTVDIYIVGDYKWIGGEKITDYLVYASLLGVVQTDALGNIAPVMIWPNPIPGEYDMVFDANQNEIYDFGIDAVDHPNHPGFTVVGQVPALTPIGIAALVGLLTIIATSTILIKRKKR